MITAATRAMRFGVPAVLALGFLVLPACKTAPRGSSGGRIDSYTTTEADRRSGSANISALLEFSDKTAEELVRDLSQIPEIREAKNRQVLELGGIYNKTRTSSTDFELIQRRLRGKLVRSRQVTDNFRIVESARRMDSEKRRVTGSDDLLQERGNQGDTDRYDSRSTYVLQGDFLEAVRGDRSQYYFEFKLTNLQTRDIVFLKSFDLGQVR